MAAAGRLLCFEDEYRPRRRAFRDPVLLKDERVLKNLLSLEDRYQPSTSYFLFQKDLRPYMRKIVATWMLEVCEEEEREEELFPLAMNYLDRVLSLTLIRKTQLQLVSSVCLLIASKVRESIAIEADKLVRYTDYSVTLDDITEWETLVLHLLRWETGSIIAHDFLDILLDRLNLGENDRDQILRHAQTLIAMCATEHNFCVHPPSLIASSSICAAAVGLLGQTWCQRVGLVNRLQDLTSIDVDCMRECQEQIEQTLVNNIKNATQNNNNNTLPDTTTTSATTTTTSNQKSTDATVMATTPTDVRDIRLVSTNDGDDVGLW